MVCGAGYGAVVESVASGIECLGSISVCHLLDELTVSVTEPAKPSCPSVKHIGCRGLWSGVNKADTWRLAIQCRAHGKWSVL